MSTSPAFELVRHWRLSRLSTAEWWYAGIATIVFLLALEQLVYRYKKKHLPGDNWTLPLIGKFSDSRNPTLEKYQKTWARGPLSALSVFNIFIVMATSNEYARKILNAPAYCEPALVASAKEILMPDNWVFLTGKSHLDFRRTLNSLFTRSALGMYLQIMDAVTRKHMAAWLEAAKNNPDALPIMFTARELNMDTSLRVFCGPHIPDEATKEIGEKYYDINKALELVNFPFSFPGTNVYKAIQARKVAYKWLLLAAQNSGKAMAEGGEVECLLDAWHKAMKDPVYKGRKEFNDRQMALAVFSFLFASQDAMTSGLIYGFQHLSEHHDAYVKIKEEQDRIRGGDRDKPITMEMVDSMTYLKAFVKESLRVRPPVVLVPYKVTKAFPISPDYTAPLNSMVISSFYDSCHDSDIYPEPDRFAPERWLDPKGSASANPQHFMVFGNGHHKCIGMEYALMQIALVLGHAVTLMEWDHERTAESSKVQIVSTLFPKDGCCLRFRPRPV